MCSFSCIQADRGILSAGCGADGSSDYWKVQNSWVSSWVESGFLRWERDKGGADECGILSGPSPYPVVSSSFAGLDGERNTIVVTTAVAVTLLADKLH